MKLANLWALGETYLESALHSSAQFLKVPVMILLVGLIAYALFCIGSLIVEYFSERRFFRAHMPSVINDIHDAAYDQVNRIIDEAELLKSQKAALTMVASNMGLPENDLFALAKTEIAKLNDHYQGIVSRNDLITKIAPMMGLMATLIPLGPGIVAMGQGNVETLSSSLLVAFDGTVAGLVTAVVSMCVAKVRKRWYARYASGMEALMTCLLEKAATARSEGIELPHGFRGAPEAARFAQGGKRGKASGTAAEGVAGTVAAASSASAFAAAPGNAARGR